MDEDELHATVDCQLLSHLVDEVSEIGFDETVLISGQASSRKSKFTSLKNNQKGESV
jgi:hypothetical protein